MAKTLYWRGSFDPAWDFTAAKTLTVDGRTFEPGQSFDKTLVPVRRLRQMFESRRLAYLVEGDDETDNTNQRMEDLRSRLVEAGIPNEEVSEERLREFASYAKDLSEDDLIGVINMVANDYRKYAETKAMFAIDVEVPTEQELAEISGQMLQINQSLIIIQSIPSIFSTPVRAQESTSEPTQDSGATTPAESTPPATDGATAPETPPATRRAPAPVVPKRVGEKAKKH